MLPFRFSSRNITKVIRAIPTLKSTTSTRYLNLPSSLHDLKLPPIMHARATVSGTTIAETDTFEFVEGNVYFPLSSVIKRDETLTPGERTSYCPWKGDGKYYDLHVNGQTVKDAAWYYPQPFEKAKMITDCVAFGKKVFRPFEGMLVLTDGVDKSKVTVEKE